MLIISFNMAWLSARGIHAAARSLALRVCLRAPSIFSPKQLQTTAAIAVSHLR